MADERSYNVEDRIRELGEDPATAYARANEAGMAGSAPAPTAIPDAPTSLEADPQTAAAAPAIATGPAMRHKKPDPFDGESAAIIGRYDPPGGAPPGPGTPGSAALPTNPLQSGHTGTIGDAEVGSVTPDYHQAPAASQPIEPPSSASELFGASYRSAQRDNPLFHEKMIHDGYAPLIRALGLPDSENPSMFNEVDSQGEARFGFMGSPSQLASQAKQGESLPFSNNYLADRPLQEYLVAALIAQRQAKDPHFLPGVPNTVDGLHAYFVKQQQQQQDADQRIIARGPGGVTGLAVNVAGSAVAGLEDPINDVAFAIPGGEGAGLLRIAARDALINGVLAAGQQPLVYQNKKEMGESYTLGDAAESVGGAAAGGAVLGPVLHVGGAAAAATGIPQALGKGVGAGLNAVGRGADAMFGSTADFLKSLPEAARAKWSGRVGGNLPAHDFFASLNNRELADFVHDATGGKLTRDQQDQINVLERAQEVGESSPYHPSPAGDGAHEGNLNVALKNLEDHQMPEVGGFPSVPSADGAGAATPAAVAERAPASSTVGRPQPVGPDEDPGAAIQSFMNKVGGAENATGNPNAKNPRSSASGNAQFTDGTFRQYFQKVYGRDPGEHPDSVLKNNPTIQHELLGALTRDNAATLERIGEKVNDGNLYLMHFLGAGDAPKVFKADPSASLEQVFGEKHAAKLIEANPFLAGKSASEVIAWAHGKMGAHVSAVHAGASPLEAATDDFRTPQLNDGALQDESAVLAPETPSEDWGKSSSMEAADTQAAPIDVPPMAIQTISNRDIHVDAERFQFKSGGDDNGVTDRLQGVEKWNPIFAGLVTAWQDNSGKFWIADGHQRLGLANRIDAATGQHIPMSAITLREADGISAEDARTYAALKNIAEQDTKHPTGAQLVDAAKVARGFGPDALRAALPPKSALARDGAALARLSDPAFGAVYNDVVPADFAAVIGHLLPERPEAHEAMIDLLRKLDPANRGQAASLVRQAIAAGIHKEHQIDLFGSHEHVTTLMLEKAKVIEKVLGELRKMKLVHKTAAEGAETLERTGSKIARERSEREAVANAQAIETVNRLAYRSGPVADAINAAATDLKSGRAKLAAVARDAAERIRELDLGSLDRESAGNPDAGERFGGNADANSDAERAADAAHSGDGQPGAGAADAGSDAAGAQLGLIPGEIGADEGDSFDVGQSGRGGAVGEESPELPAQSRDPEQPGLHELEQATERFSDPNGKAVHQQAESLEHDLKADVSRSEQRAAATKELEKAKPGEFKTVEPYKEEPGYHRFRFVADDGKAIGGNYTVHGDTIDNLSITSSGVRNQNQLGPKAMRSLFEQLRDAHPEVEYVHGFRKSGARVLRGTGAQDVWFHLGDNGLKLLDGPPDAFDKFKATLDGLKLVTTYMPAMSDREVAEHLAQEAIGEAINDHAVKIGRELEIGDETAADKFHAEIADKLMGEKAGDREFIKRETLKAIKDGRLPLEDLGEPEHIGPNEDAKKPGTLSTANAPEKTIKSADYAGPEISPEEAKAKLEEWKAEAQRIGRESPPPENHVILSFFDDSGIWSKPYEDMGYKVVRLDLNHGDDLLQEMGNYMLAIDKAKEDGLHFAGVLAQPPCTTFASSGARWWQPRHNRKWSNAIEKMFGSWAAKMFESPVEYNQFLVAATEEYIHRAAPDFYAIENPNGRIAEMTGLPKPTLVIQPHHFGDPYTKWTNLYGKFNPELETANVHPSEGSRAHNLRGRDEKEDGLRSQTPEGLAYAFALANHPGAGELHPLANYRSMGIEDRAHGLDNRFETFATKTPALKAYDEGYAIEPAKLTPEGEAARQFAGDHYDRARMHESFVKGATGQDERYTPVQWHLEDAHRAGEEWAAAGGEKAPRKPIDAPPGHEWVERGVTELETPEGAENGSNELLGQDQGPDPAIAERHAQQVALKAASSLTAPGDVDQLGEIGLPLMDAANQMSFRIGEEGDEITAADLLKDLEADDKTIKAIKDCL